MLTLLVIFCSIGGIWLVLGLLGSDVGIRKFRKYGDDINWREHWRGAVFIALLGGPINLIYTLFFFTGENNTQNWP